MDVELNLDLTQKISIFYSHSYHKYKQISAKHISLQNGLKIMDELWYLSLEFCYLCIGYHIYNCLLSIFYMKFAENVDNFLHATTKPRALYTLVLIQNTDNVHQLPPVSSDTGCSIIVVPCQFMTLIPIRNHDLTTCVIPPA